MVGEFLKALAQELGTGPAPLHPALSPALTGDRGNARQWLDLLGVLEAIPIRAEGRQQARGQGVARCRKTFKQGSIRMPSKNLGDLLIEPLEGCRQRPDLLGQNLSR
jgi:hypothetical protein